MVSARASLCEYIMRLLKYAQYEELYSTACVLLYVYSNWVCVQHVYVVGDWIRKRFEPPGVFQMTDGEKKILLARLVRSTRSRKHCQCVIHS